MVPRLRAAVRPSRAIYTEAEIRFLSPEAVCEESKSRESEAVENTVVESKETQSGKTEKKKRAEKL